MRTRTILFAAGCIFLLAAGYWFGQTNKPTHTADMPAMQSRIIHAAGQAVRVDVAATPAEKERGLGGRSGLSDDEGMLFVFETDGVHAFWMKDMRFSIDILWIAADGSVIYIVPNLAPESYPASFAPSEPARYVLELSAGWAERHSLKIGDKIAL